MATSANTDLHIKIQLLKYRNEILYFENSVMNACFVPMSNISEISKFALLLKQIHSQLQLFFHLNVQTSAEMNNMMKMIQYEKKRFVTDYKLQKRDFEKLLDTLKFKKDLTLLKFHELYVMKVNHNNYISTIKDFTADNWIMYVEKWCKYLNKKIERELMYESILNRRFKNVNTHFMKKNETSLPKQIDFEKLDIDIAISHQVHLDYQSFIKKLKNSLASINNKISQCRKFNTNKISAIDDINVNTKLLSVQLKNLLIEETIITKEINQILIKVKNLENVSESCGNPTIVDYIKSKRQCSHRK